MFQLISLRSALRLFILTWNFYFWMTETHFGYYFLNYIKMIAPETETVEGMFETINFTPSMFYVKV